MKILFLALTLVFSILPARAFNLTFTWDFPPGTTFTDTFTTNIAKFADVTGVNVYRGDTVTNFVLFVSLPATNLVTLSNLPPAMGFICIKSFNAFGESGPSNTNQVFPPIPSPLSQNLKATR